MRKISTLLGTLASLGLIFGLSWTIGTSEAHASDYRLEVPNHPCGDQCSPFQEGGPCWCVVLDPIIVHPE